MLTEAIVLLIIIYIIFILLCKIRPKKVVTSDGKAVLITGCDSGFGNRLALRLCEMGFRVYATVLSNTSEGAQQLKMNPYFVNQMIVFQMNVKNDAEVNKIYEKVKNDLEISHHVLWAVVNNAGVYPVTLLEWGTLDTYREVFEVNVFGTVRVTRTFLPLIRISKGRIINIGSVLGRVSVNANGIYCMSKQSLVAFTDTLRRELNRFNVSVSLIEPSHNKTPLTDRQHLTKKMYDIWNESSKEVKECYVSPNSVKKLMSGFFDLFPPRQDIDYVIDDMIDSINNCSPKAFYRPMDFLHKIAIYLDMFFPCVFDWVIIILEKIILSD